MTPSQRLMLTARQAGEQAQRLLGWLEQGRERRPEFASLVDDVEAIAGAVGRVIDAVEQRPAVGLIGGQGSGKTALVSALCASAERPFRAEFASREASLDVLASVMPQGGGSRASAIIRLSTADAPAAPRGFPVRVRVLGQLDLVKILFRAQAAHVGTAAAEAPSAHAVARVFADAERQLQPRAVAGFSARDIVDLREDVHGFDPGSPLLRALSAAGYWDRLAVTIAHLPESERARLLALVWNEQPALSAIYAALSGALETLGHAADVYCELEAIVAREPGTGWMVPHRASIAAAATQDSLAHALGPVPVSTVQVSGRFGGSMAIERAVIATLAAEIPLKLKQSPIPGLDDTDLLTFPTAAPIVDFARPRPAAATDGPASASAAAPAGGGLGLEAAMALIGHAKAVYLVERSTRRHELVSIMACLDPDQPPDDSLAAALGDWIEVAQGAEPHQRERFGTAFFLVVSRTPPAGGIATGARIVPWPDGARDPRVRRGLAEGLGVGHDWPLEWTPNRAFEAIFAHVRSVKPGVSGRSGEPSLRLVPTGPDAGGGAEPNTDALVRALVPVSGRATRDRQLVLHLGELRRRLRARVLRHHLSNDPLEIAEWRRQVTNVTVSRLLRPQSSGRDRGVRAGTLITALQPTPRELAAALDAGRDGGAGHQASAAATTAPRGISTLSRHDPAAAVVIYWLRSMRQAGRSARFCRHLGVPQAVLQHMTDEIAIGAVRTGLIVELAGAMERARSGGRDGPADTTELAMRAQRLIGSYLARMPAAPAAWTSEPQARPARGATGMISAGYAGGAGGSGATRLDGRSAAGAEGAPRQPAFGSEIWTGAYAGLVEANIAAVSGLVGAPERDRELGELLMGFASSPFEVEL